MREILFRGKRKDNGNWIEGSLVVKDDDRYWISVTSTKDYGTFEVDPQSVGQLTPLVSKSGKRVFEGDIIEHRYCNDETEKEEVVSQVVKFELLSAGDDMDMDSYGYHVNPGWNGDFEVIGNIFDNPELCELDEGGVE